MLNKSEIIAPAPMAAASFTDAEAAVARIEEIYRRNTDFLRTHFEAYLKGEPPARRVRATYPFVRIATATHARLDSTVSSRVLASTRRPSRGRCSSAAT
jgi:AMP nucleosidase